MKIYSYFVILIAGVCHFANATILTKTNPDKPCEVVTATANGSSEYYYNLYTTTTFTWNWNATNGGDYSLVMLPDGLQDGLNIYYEEYDNWNASGVGPYELWQVIYRGNNPPDRQLIDSGTNSYWGFPLEIGSLSDLYDPPWGFLSKDSKVTIQLKTGGVSGSKRKNVFCLTANATGYRHLVLSSLDYITPVLSGSYSIVPTSIQVAGNTLDTNGNAYAVYSDNSEVDITPKTPEKFYSVGVSAQKFKLQIGYNGADITDTNVSAVVGQKISLTCSLVGPPGSTPPPITNYMWTVGGYAVSNFYVSSDNSTGMVIEPFPKTNSDVNFYWADGGSKQVSCEATVIGEKITAQTTFNVIRPTIDFIGSINGSVALDANYAGSSGDVYLHFGGSIDNGVTNWGINCVASNPDLGGYDTNSSAGFHVVQIILNKTISGTKTDGSGHTNAPITDALDNDYPTKNMGNGNGTVFSDAPAIGGFPTNYNQISISESFRTVLMFIPDESDAIPVPIKEICWNWGGAISYTNSQWVLTSTNAAITVNNHDTLDFPFWTSNVKNTY